MERKKFIENVANAFIENNKSLYFGAGLSQNFDLPNWHQIFKRLIKSLKNRFPELKDIDTKDPDCYAIGEYILSIVKERELVLEKISRILCSPSDLNNNQKMLYSNIVKQEYNSIWTTNFDDLFEKTLNSSHYPINVVDLNSGIKDYRLLKHKRTLYKINGSISAPKKNIILTKSDFEAYQEINKSFYSMLKRELICNTFLFIGCSFTDGILRPVLRELKQVFKDDFKHYAIFVKSKKDKNQMMMIEDLQERYGIYSYLIEEEDPKNIIVNLNSLLNAIYKYSINRNVFISGSISDPQDNLEHSQFIKKLTYALYAHGYKIIGGVGKKISYYIGSATSSYMKENKETERTNFLEQEFFYLDDNDAREKMLNRARHSIFIYCPSFDDRENVLNSGVYKELRISLNNNNTIIPLVSTKIGNRKYSLYNEIPFIPQELSHPTDEEHLIREIITFLDNHKSIIESY